MIGLPPMGGTWSKWFLALGTADASQLVLMAVLMVSSLLNIAYLMPIPIRGFFCKPDEDNPGPLRIQEAPLLCVLPLAFTAIGCVVLFFLADELYRLVLPITHP